MTCCRDGEGQERGGRGESGKRVWPVCDGGKGTVHRHKQKVPVGTPDPEAAFRVFCLNGWELFCLGSAAAHSWTLE